MERWQSGRSRTLGKRVSVRTQGSNPCLSVNSMKIIVLAVVVMLLSTPGIAQETKTERPQKKELLSFTGQVILKKFGDTLSGAMPKLAVLSDRGEKMVFTLYPSTHVVNEYIENIRMGDIPNESCVTVDYWITPGGDNAADLIQVIKAP